MTATPVTATAGDTLPILRRQLLDDGNPIDLTTATGVRLFARDVLGRVVVNGAACTIATPKTEGRVTFAPGSTPPGRYLAQFVIAFDGDTLSVPNGDGYVLLDIGANPADDGPTSGTLVHPRSLALWLRDPTIETDPSALYFLEQSSNLVRNEIGQRLDYVAEDVIDLTGPGGAAILLPELPVIEVLEVVEHRLDASGVDTPTTLVAGVDYRAELGWDGRLGILRRSPAPIGRWTRGYPVEVTYSHGYRTITTELDPYADGPAPHPLPGVIETVVTRVAARGYTNPDYTVSEKIGNYEVVRALRSAAGTPPVSLYLSAGDMADLAPYYPGSNSGART